ncbi:hypothetical protein SAMN05518863_102262 [Candidatus Pantoea symbiotica]|uniref:Uncharacterized protein n=1 Tax=Candidatus Pantoea symbiotica TaxID=1884370 RepID=A0A1I3T924_9GAMM|nr:hypothetical protein SAMN05518863_102262 [Pantoea symbiotica]SFU51400.1 hypothetical protein SAMN05518864_102335 [Pantoea sp. YR525]
MRSGLPYTYHGIQDRCCGIKQKVIIARDNAIASKGILSH